MSGDPRLASPAVLRAGRALLGWSVADLARAANVSHRAVSEAEMEGRRSHVSTIVDVVMALEAWGIEFIAESEDAAPYGVAWRSPPQAPPEPEPEPEPTRLEAEADGTRAALESVMGKLSNPRHQKALQAALSRLQKRYDDKG